LQEFTEKYPGNYDVQLKRLAEYFETKFGKASLGPAKLMEEKTFSRKLEIPYAYLSEEVHEVLQSWLQAVPQAELVKFTQFLLNQVCISERSHKTSGLGLRMLLSAIVRSTPDTLRETTERDAFIQKYLGDTPASYTNRDTKAAVLSEDTMLVKAQFVPLVVWLFGQAIGEHPVLAFSLWVEFLLPFLFLPVPEGVYSSIRNFFDLLFANASRLTEADPSAIASALERLAAYREGLSGKQLGQDFLNSVYSTIENAIVWRNPSTVHNYLEVYLSHAASHNDLIGEESQRKALRALAIGKGYASRKWQKLYPCYVSQSIATISYLQKAGNWEKYVSPKDHNKILVEDLAELLQFFLYTNHKISEAHNTVRVRNKEIKVEQRAIDASNAACKELLRRTGVKISRPHARQAGARSPGLLGALVYFLFFLLLAIAIAVLYLRSSHPELYEQGLQVGLDYSQKVKEIWNSAQASREVKELLHQVAVMKDRTVSTVHSFITTHFS